MMLSASFSQFQSFNNFNKDVVDTVWIKPYQDIDGGEDERSVRFED